MSLGEMVDILDDNGLVIATIPRAEAEAHNHTTQNVLVFVFNSRGEVWLQLRPKSKNHYPGMWDVSACGGLMSGEEPEAAAMRELNEETGLANVTLYYVETFMNVFPGDNGEERRRLSHVYISQSEGEPQPNEEVDAFKLWNPSDLLGDIDVHPNMYIPSIAAELQIALRGYRQFFDEAPKDRV